VLGAEGLLDHATTFDLAGVSGELGEDEKALAADGAADVGRESGWWLGEVHGTCLYEIARARDTERKTPSSAVVRVDGEGEHPGGPSRTLVDRGCN